MVFAGGFLGFSRNTPRASWLFRIEIINLASCDVSRPKITIPRDAQYPHSLIIDGVHDGVYFSVFACAWVPDCAFSAYAHKCG
jgi:hypothetical protein